MGKKLTWSLLKQGRIKEKTSRAPVLICAMAQKSLLDWSLKISSLFIFWTWCFKKKQTKIAVSQGCFDTRSLNITSRCVWSILIRTCPSVHKLGTFNLTGIQVSCILSTIKFWFFVKRFIYWEYGMYYRAHGFFNEGNLLRKWSTLVSGRWYTQYSHTFLKFR